MVIIEFVIVKIKLDFINNDDTEAIQDKRGRFKC